jgi:hypothetical protein
VKKGSCHCGAVRFEVDAPLDGAVACNCSMCGRAGTLLAMVPAEKFRLLSGAESLTDYLFHSHQIHHTFCKVCGIKPFARGAGPDGKETVAVNVRCVEGIDPKTIPTTWFDGASM